MNEYLSAFHLKHLEFFHCMLNSTTATGLWIPETNDHLPNSIVRRMNEVRIVEYYICKKFYKHSITKRTVAEAPLLKLHVQRNWTMWAKIFSFCTPAFISDITSVNCSFPTLACTICILGLFKFPENNLLLFWVLKNNKRSGKSDNMVSLQHLPYETQWTVFKVLEIRLHFSSQDIDVTFSWTHSNC